MTQIHTKKEEMNLNTSQPELENLRSEEPEQSASPEDATSAIFIPAELLESEDAKAKEQAEREQTQQEKSSSDDSLPQDDIPEQTHRSDPEEWTVDPDETTRMIDLSQTPDEKSTDEDLFAEDPTEEKSKSLPKEPKKKKKRKTGAIVAAVILGIVGACYLVGVYHYSTSFFPATYVNGFDAANHKPETLQEELDTETASRSVKLIGSDGVEMTVQSSDIGFGFDDSIDFDQALSEQNPWIWPMQLIKPERIDLQSGVTYDEKKLADLVKTNPFTQNPKIVETENAHAVYNGTDFEVKEEIYGTKIDPKTFEKAIVDGLTENTTEIRLAGTDLYIQPKITKDNETLLKSVQKLNNSLGTTVNYKFGSVTETLNKNTFASWLKTNDKGEAVVDQEKLGEYLEGLAAKYDTLYTWMPFKTASGIDTRVYAQGYGFQIDQEAEAKELSTILLNSASQDREPVYAVKGYDRASGKAVGGDYIEINIPAQTMYLFVNGERIISTPITSGTKGVYDTPRGLFQIAYKDTHVTLRGEGYASPVTFWIPFNGDVGIHDASWRSKYGGTEYVRGGSHGCINTPYGAVSTIYDYAYAGMPVVVY